MDAIRNRKREQLQSAVELIGFVAGKVVSVGELTSHALLPRIKEAQAGAADIGSGQRVAAIVLVAELAGLTKTLVRRACVKYS